MCFLIFRFYAHAGFIVQMICAFYVFFISFFNRNLLFFGIHSPLKKLYFFRTVYDRSLQYTSKAEFEGELLFIMDNLFL